MHLGSLNLCTNVLVLLNLLNQCRYCFHYLKVAWNYELFCFVKTLGVEAVNKSNTNVNTLLNKRAAQQPWVSIKLSSSWILLKAQLILMLSYTLILMTCPQRFRMISNKRKPHFSGKKISADIKGPVIKWFLIYLSERTSIHLGPYSSTPSRFWSPSRLHFKPCFLLVTYACAGVLFHCFVDVLTYIYLPITQLPLSLAWLSKGR